MSRVAVWIGRTVGRVGLMWQEEDEAHVACEIRGSNNRNFGQRAHAPIAPIFAIVDRSDDKLLNGGVGFLIQCW